jgi:hypothetical protein
MRIASVIGLVTVLAASNAQAADQLSLGTVQLMHIDGDGARAVFGINPVPMATTCSYFGNQFFMDIASGTGNNMLSVLLLAKAQGTPIHVWYKTSPNPGTNETNGCNYPSTMARAFMIGFP